jgi:hypothetical protein
MHEITEKSEQVFMNKKLAGRVAADERRFVLQVSEIEFLSTTLQASEELSLVMLVSEANRPY